MGIFWMIIVSQHKSWDPSTEKEFYSFHSSHQKGGQNYSIHNGRPNALFFLLIFFRLVLIKRLHDDLLGVRISFDSGKREIVLKQREFSDHLFLLIDFIF